MTRRDDLLVDIFRSSGALLLRGVEVRVPALPRTTSAMTILRLEAKRDPAVRKAYEAAVAQTERARQLQPQILRRACGVIIDVR